MARIYLSIIPWSARVTPGQELQFQVSAYDEDGMARERPMTWGADSGEIGPDGSFRAPETPGSLRVWAEEEESGARAEALIEVDVEDSEGPLLSNPPGRPDAEDEADREDEFLDLAGKTQAVCDLVREALPGLADVKAWRDVEEREDDYFDLVLEGERRRAQPARPEGEAAEEPPPPMRVGRLHVKVLPACNPQYLLELFRYADSVLATLQGEGTREDHAYLILAERLFVRPGIERAVAQFNELFSATAAEVDPGEGASPQPEDEREDREPGGPTAFFAFGELGSGGIQVPGVERPWLALDEWLDGEGAEGDPSPPAEAPPAPEAGVAVGTIETPEELSRTVLLVDDDPLALGVTRDLLEEAGYTVAEARNWSTFREAVTSRRFGILVLDVHLPTLTGDKLALFVRDFLEEPRPRILLHSGLERDQLQELAERVGADGFVCKGSDEAEYHEALQEASRAYLQEGSVS